MSTFPFVRLFGFEIRIHVSWAIILAAIVVTVTAQVERPSARPKEVEAELLARADAPGEDRVVARVAEEIRRDIRRHAAERPSAWKRIKPRVTEHLHGYGRVAPLGEVHAQAAGHGVDLHRRHELQAGRERRGTRAGQLAIRREVVVVRDREQPDARRVGLLEQLSGLEDAVAAPRVRVDVRDRVAGHERHVAGDRRVAQGHVRPRRRG